MKKLLLILLIFPLVFSSCKDRAENDDPNYSAKIIGTWTFENAESRIIISYPSSTISAIDEHIKSKISSATYTFTEDGRFSRQINGASSNGTYQITGNVVTLSIDGAPETEDIAIIIPVDSDTNLGLFYNETQYYTNIIGQLPGGNNGYVEKVITAYHYTRL